MKATAGFALALSTVALAANCVSAAANIDMLSTLKSFTSTSEGNVVKDSNYRGNAWDSSPYLSFATAADSTSTFYVYVRSGDGVDCTSTRSVSASVSVNANFNDAQCSPTLAQSTIKAALCPTKDSDFTSDNEFIIDFNCKVAGQSVIELNINGIQNNPIIFIKTHGSAVTVTTEDSNYSAVVTAGVTESQWASPQVLKGATENSITFQVFIAAGALSHPPDRSQQSKGVQPVLEDAVTVTCMQKDNPSQKGCNPHLSGALYTTMKYGTPYPREIVYKNQSLTIEYDCGVNDEAVVDVTIESAPFAPVKFSFYKACDHSPGFLVSQQADRLQEGQVANAVVDGSAKANFDVGNNRECRTAYNWQTTADCTLYNDEDNAPAPAVTTFWFFLDSKEQYTASFTTPTIKAINPDICDVSSVTGAAAGDSPSVTPGASAKDLNIHYSCKANGYASFEMNFRVGKYREVNLAWSVAQGPRPGFAMSAFIPSGPNMNIGNHYDVVRDGEVLGNWRVDSSDIIVVPADVSVTTFNLTESLYGNQKIKEILVQSGTQGACSIQTQNMNNVLIDSSQYIWNMTYWCIPMGVQRVKLTAKVVLENFQSFTFNFDKDTIWESNLFIKVDTAQPCLSCSEQKDPEMVNAEGTVTQAWGVDRALAQKDYAVDVPERTFQVRYGKSDCSPSESPELFVKIGGPVLSFNTSETASGNKDVCMPYITSPGSWHKTQKQLNYCSETTFTVVYNCTTESAVYNLIAHLPVSDNVGSHKTPPLWSWTLASAATVPQAPDTVVATRGGSFGEMWAGGVVDLEWKTPYDNGAFITGYTVMYTNLKTGDVNTFNITADEGCAKIGNPCLGNSVKAKVSALNNADKYDFAVQAINKKGLSESADQVIAPGQNTTFIAGMVFLGLFIIAGGVWGGYRLRDALSGPEEAAEAPLLGGGQSQQKQQGYQAGETEEDLDARLAALDQA